jgi:hypothetical protein
MEIGNIISNAIILLAILIVYYWQKKKINTLENTINSQNSILNSIQTYFDIFKVDEVKKYTELTVENVKLEYKKSFDSLINSQNIEIDNLKKNHVPKESFEALINLYKKDVKAAIEVAFALMSATAPQNRLGIRRFINDEESLHIFNQLDNSAKHILIPKILEVNVASTIKVSASTNSKLTVNKGE